MPSGRDPNQTFVTDNARASKRGILIPLLIVGLLVVGGGLLIAWGLNSFFPGLLGNAPDPVAGSATPTPTTTSEVASATPVPTPAPSAGPTPSPNVAGTAPQIPTPPTTTVAVVRPTPTAAPRDDLRVETTTRPTAAGAATSDPTPPKNAFSNIIPPEVVSPVPTVAPTLVAKLDPTPTPLPRVQPTQPPPPPTAPARPPGAEIDTSLGNPENATIKRAVLDRIDQMPDLSPENRDKLYSRVERTPGMGRAATVSFEVGETGLKPIDVARLRDELEEGPARKLLDDPTVVFVVLGYADKTGGVEVNKRITQARANAVVNVMRNQLKLANAMHAVAMGASTMFGTGREQYDKNRIVEVWAVLP